MRPYILWALVLSSAMITVGSKVQVRAYKGIAKSWERTAATWEKTANAWEAKYAGMKLLKEQAEKAIPVCQVNHAQDTNTKTNKLMQVIDSFPTMTVEYSYCLKDRGIVAPSTPPADKVYIFTDEQHRLWVKEPNGDIHKMEPGSSAPCSDLDHLPAYLDHMPVEDPRRRRQ